MKRNHPMIGKPGQANGAAQGDGQGHAMIVVPRQLEPARTTAIPAMIAAAGDAAGRRFIDFFTVNIRNPNTRAAYARAVAGFCRWCQDRNVRLDQVSPFLVAAFIEQLGQERSKPTVKQTLAANGTRSVSLASLIELGLKTPQFFSRAAA